MRRAPYPLLLMLVWIITIATIDCSDGSRRTSEQDVKRFFEACRTGNISVVNEMLKTRSAKSLVNARDDSDVTPLHEAALKGHKAIVEVLLARGADVNSKTSDGFTPLLDAALNGHTSVVEVLLEKGALVDPEIDFVGVTPFFVALIRKHFDICTLLLKKGANIDHRGVGGDTCLHVVPLVPGTEAVEFLLKNKANVNAKNAEGETPLHAAAQWGRADVLELLIQHGANINAANKQGLTALHFAALESTAEVAKLLIAKGANINAKTTARYVGGYPERVIPAGATPLRTASIAHNKDVVLLLKQLGAKN